MNLIGECFIETEVSKGLSDGRWINVISTSLKRAKYTIQDVKDYINNRKEVNGISYEIKDEFS